jgi:hypothetical protein
MRTDLLQASYRSLDVLLGATAFGFCFVFLLSIPLLRTMSGGVEKPIYLNLASDNRAAPIFWGNRVQCTDHSTESAERRSAYERVEKALFPTDTSRPEVDMNIPDSYAIADPDKFWTVYVGQLCGSEIMYDVGALFTVDRRTGHVSRGADVMFAELIWQRDASGWKKIRFERGR